MTDTVAALQYGGKYSQEGQMDRAKHVETVDDNFLDTDWRDNVDIGVQYAFNHQEVFDTLVELRKIWDGRLGSTDMAKPSI